MPDDTPNPDRAQVREFGRSNPWPATDADVRRLQDEVVAYLTQDRDTWRERALQAEADANVMALCMAVCDGRVFVQLNQPQRSMIAARLREAYDRADARKRGGGAA